MRHVVVEGVDNSGKSTLVKAIQDRSPWLLIQASEGPPKYPGEMDLRVKSYLSFSPTTIFDRHPCVSQVIYGSMRSHQDPVSEYLLKQFYASPCVFVYCDPVNRGMSGHTFNQGVDTPEHLESVKANYHRLLGLYRAWAITYAHIIYRIGDNMTATVEAINAMRTKT